MIGEGTVARRGRNIDWSAWDGRLCGGGAARDEKHRADTDGIMMHSGYVAVCGTATHIEDTQHRRIYRDYISGSMEWVGDI